MYFACEKDMNFGEPVDRMLWYELCPSKKFYVETLTSFLTLFGNRAFREIIYVKCVHKGGTLV